MPRSETFERSNDRYATDELACKTLFRFVFSYFFDLIV